MIRLYIIAYFFTKTIKSIKPICLILLNSIYVIILVTFAVFDVIGSVPVL
jgi:hypothetical protein